MSRVESSITGTLWGNATRIPYIYVYRTVELGYNGGHAEYLVGPVGVTGRFNERDFSAIRPMVLGEYAGVAGFDDRGKPVKLKCARIGRRERMDVHEMLVKDGIIARRGGPADW
ncbi:MAG: hypothetical protein HYS81_03785 [Candidatus Aenigmatarchaeota archaeon]|nr:MAG: hypothetical protein HYS81_03785 [Candidatus Aenigmarchaeota archaeon]